jgi:hypothetical protein
MHAARDLSPKFAVTVNTLAISPPSERSRLRLTTHFLALLKALAVVSHGNTFASRLAIAPYHAVLCWRPMTPG